MIMDWIFNYQIHVHFRFK